MFLYSHITGVHASKNFRFDDTWETLLKCLSIRSEHEHPRCSSASNWLTDTATQYPREKFMANRCVSQRVAKDRSPAFWTQYLLWNRTEWVIRTNASQYIQWKMMVKYYELEKLSSRRLTEEINSWCRVTKALYDEHKRYDVNMAIYDERRHSLMTKSLYDEWKATCSDLNTIWRMSAYFSYCIAMQWEEALYRERGSTRIAPCQVGDEIRTLRTSFELGLDALPYSMFSTLHWDCLVIFIELQTQFD